MFDELKPDSEAFDSFQAFCIATAIEACYPKKQDFYYNLLEHPILPGKILMLVYDTMHETFYLIQVGKGGPISFDHPEDIAFYSWHVNEPTLPVTAAIGDDQITLGYNLRPDVIGSRVISHKNYGLLKGLFDEDNPPPWTEVQG